MSELTNTFTDIADAIREKTGKSALMTPSNMANEVRSISGGGSDADLAITRSKLGAKNLLPNNLPSQVIKGVTITVNDTDGSINCNGIATGGEVNVSTGSLIFEGTLPVGTYIFTSGQQENFQGAGLAYKINNGTAVFVIGEKTFSISDGDTLKVWLYAQNGYGWDNFTYYPMIRLSTDHDSTYQPYAMTNKELTDILETLWDTEELILLGSGTNLHTEGINLNDDMTKYETLLFVSQANGNIYSCSVPVSLFKSTTSSSQILYTSGVAGAGGFYYLSDSSVGTGRFSTYNFNGWVYGIKNNAGCGSGTSDVIKVISTTCTQSEIRTGITIPYPVGMSMSNMLVLNYNVTYNNGTITMVGGSNASSTYQTHYVNYCLSDKSLVSYK